MPTSVRKRSGILPQEVIRLIHIQKESVSIGYALFLFLLYLAPKHRLTTERQPRDEEVPRMALRVSRPNYPHSKEKAQYIE